ncbi:G/U mismatch-specific uracil-DNA glycosylase [Raineyella antarctica]|uniref:G/U mismatch-specific uracil-DNA glycosylase n=1 Tax=Raineyella antarctica TaxID=1577474 RepID=A0A1G6GGT2_9ACTN|nr:mismatch-specific DNA-glycosylase [Raineyella antarctica]SDB80955.1 G/U mismatch-specific uracil-DNA glycosylase [Raineyella antarctica]
MSTAQPVPHQPVPDLLPDDLRLLFVGINPGLWSAATGAHFARPGNRFWPALALAGITEHPVDCKEGMSEADRRHVEGRGVGITNFVSRASARADELSTQEIRDGAVRLQRFVAEHHPRVVAIVGLGAYRTGFRRPRARAGRQPELLAGAELWVLPNPSGLNAHETVASLAEAYGAAADAAGIERRPQRATR